MQITLSDLIHQVKIHSPQNIALIQKEKSWTYEDLGREIERFASMLVGLGYHKGDRVAVFLRSQFETVVSIFGCAQAGVIFVPINHSLKAAQVFHILRDCNVKMLVTTRASFNMLQEGLADCYGLDDLLCVGKKSSYSDEFKGRFLSYDEKMAYEEGSEKQDFPTLIDQDIAAIFYTSGSTGKPKGVVLSHKNMVTGAFSVSSYLKHTENDRILSVLPLSFDAGFSQLTTAFATGSSVVLINYLMPNDVIKAAIKYKATGLTAVPPLWIKLMALDWPKEFCSSLRYIATTGGRMPVSVTKEIAKRLKESDIYLMYGLTEAFRSTYLDPKETLSRPTSIGKAIPNAEILIVRPDGSECDPDEVGELVHRGALVSLGYWNDIKKTQKRFKKSPVQNKNIYQEELAVWSGDMVKKDSQGFIYFVGRTDEMIKTSGFRVSPTELEDVILASGHVMEVAAFGIEDEELGQVIHIIVTKKPDNSEVDVEGLLEHCRAELPNYMVPEQVFEWADLPKNPNGKIDRNAIKDKLTDDQK